MTRRRLENLLVAGAFLPAVVLSLPAAVDSRVDCGRRPTHPRCVSRETASDYLIIGRAELLSLPTSSASYTAMQAIADRAIGTPDLANQDSKVAGQTVATALVYARTGVSAYRTKVTAVLSQVPSANMDGARVLSVARQVAGFVIAADLVGYRAPSFVSWASDIRTRYIGGHGRWVDVTQTSTDTASNWGAWAMASRIAASLYVGDGADVAAAVPVFRAYLGDRSAYVGFRPTRDYDPAWDCDPALSLVGINRQCGARSGAVIEDASRSAGSRLDATGIMYSWEGLGGATLTARLLNHAGYTPWAWSDSALRRAGEFLHRNGGYPPPYSTNQVPAWEINAAYGLSLGPVNAAGLARQFCCTDWLNERAAVQ
jgi:hypothetical protein